MNKKKVCIGIIIFLVIVIIGVNLARVFSASKELQISDASDVINEDTENTNSTENIISDNLEENTFTVTEIPQENNNEVTENDIVIENEDKTIQNDIKTSKETSKGQENKKQDTPNITKKENSSVQGTAKIEPKQELKQEQQNNTTKENKTPSTDNSSNTKGKEQQTKVEETYTVNNTMINKIIKTIQNNESEFMKIYGYTIQVDSSIKNMTSQFTFTENRVIGAIKNKFGTIRVYAEDHYKNGQFIMTQCYII